MQKNSYLRNILAAFCFLLIPAIAVAQKQNSIPPLKDKRTAPGAALLFKDIPTRLTPMEQHQIYQSLHLKLSQDKKEFLIDGYPVTSLVYPVDLNGDGIEEVFVILGSVSLYGSAGSSFYLYTKSKEGKYSAQDELTGARPVILPGKTGAYPEIVAGGPGLEYPVFKWNGTKYTSYKKMKDADLAKTKSEDVEVCSKTYTDAMKH